MSIDPHEMESPELKAALQQELGEISAADLDRMTSGATPGESKIERGRVSGRIVSVRGGDVFVDIGGKSEAFLPIDEFDSDQPPVAGEQHTFLLHGRDAESGLMRLSLREARLEANFDSLQIGDMLEARVTGLNIGGLEMSAKGVRAFMPKSQVDTHRVEDFTPYIGRRLECEVTEIDRKGRTVVVSRRKIVDRQREQARQEARDTLAEGQTRRGTVRRLTDFGAFVDIGGIEGLLHVGEISYARIKHPRDLLKEGDQIDVQVLKIDRAKDRISLGMKQLQPDPWNVVEANYRVGDTVDARVVRLLDFGAFAELAAGVEGLIPVSEMSWTQRVRHPRDILKEGDAVRVAVSAVDLEKRKITLSLKAMGEDPWKSAADRYPPETVLSGLVKRLAEFGAFVQLEDGIEGLVHISEMSDKHIRTPGEAARVGEIVKVRVKAVDIEQKRISLSMRLEPPKPMELSGPRASASGGPADAALAVVAAPPRKRKKPLKGGLD